MSAEHFASKAEASARGDYDYLTDPLSAARLEQYGGYVSPSPAPARNAQQSAPGKPARTAQELYDRTAPSVVQVSAPMKLFHLIPYDEALGTGFFVSSGPPNSCEVATAYHVGEDEKQVTVTTHDGKSYQATPEKLDPQHDLAVYKLHGVTEPAQVCRDLSLNTNAEAHLPVLVLDAAESPTHPEAVVGETLGLRPRTDIHEWQRWGVEDMKAPMLATNLQTKPGYSGGPVVDANEQVRGIHVMHDGPAYEELAQHLQDDLDAIRKGT